MKVSKRQLEQIIKEELEATLAEKLSDEEAEEQLNEVDPSVLADPSVMESVRILIDAAARVGIELLVPAATLAILASKGTEAVKKVRGVEDEEL